MDFQPLVSIIIPVYKGANYMRQAIDSALAQTYPNCEVIVVNDGSPDNGETERIARGYGEAIRYFWKENGGVASALNFGIEQMRGTYFSWLSHDDVYLPEKVQRQIEYIHTHSLQDCILYSNHELIDPNGAHVAFSSLTTVPRKDQFRALYNMHSIHGCTMLIPKNILVAAGNFPENLPSTQDYELWLRLCQTTPFAFQDAVLVQARTHPEQGSRSMPFHRKEVRKLFYRHLPELLVFGKQSLPGLQAEEQETILLLEALDFRITQGNLGTVWDTFWFSIVRLQNTHARLALCKKIFCNKDMFKALAYPVYFRLPLPVRSVLKKFKAYFLPPTTCQQ